MDRNYAVTKTLPMNLSVVSAIAILIPLLTTCTPIHAISVTPSPMTSPSPTPSHTLTPTSIATPTATQTPTATPTPTPTAQPLSVTNDGRVHSITRPSPQPGAPCGLVDTLDFPVDPPDAQNVAIGGQDFGNFREFFDGYHAGEDWWRYRGVEANFGVPVHSIGHGQVTYAAPNGWGADKGVMVVRHDFADGSDRYAFYGHLDPPSVVLRAGDCVTRGDVIGAMGRPRGAPHLHFEIRATMPDRPGPGYWSSDPRLAGWEPPSQFIWDHRIAMSPGVVWTQSDTSTFRQSLGALCDGTFAIQADHHILGIDLTDGSLRWQQPISTTSTTTAINTNAATLYVTGPGGKLHAFRIPEAQNNTNIHTAYDDPELSLTPQWDYDLRTWGRSTLLPLPGGGVAVFFARRMFGISPSGELLWKQEATGLPEYWALGDDHLVVSLQSRDVSLWTMTAASAVTWKPPIKGRPAIVGDQIWIHNDEGVYQLYPETLSAEVRHPLPVGISRLGAIVALSDGGILMAHLDYTDKRLIALNADGTMRWQRSYAGQIEGQIRLHVAGDRVYATAQTDSRASTMSSFYTSSEISVFSIDLDTATLTRIFTAATRRPEPTYTAIHLVDGHRFLINIGGVSLTLFDPQLATSEAK